MHAPQDCREPKPTAGSTGTARMSCRTSRRRPEILLRQFQSPLIYILVAAAVVAVIAGDVKDAGFIAAVLAINAVIGGYQE